MYISFTLNSKKSYAANEMKLNQLLFTERFSAEERAPQIKRIDDDRTLTQMKSSEKS